VGESGLSEGGDEEAVVGVQQAMKEGWEGRRDG